MTKKILAIVALILIVAISVVAYSFLKTPEVASGPIEAIPLTTEVDVSLAADRDDVATQEANTAVERVEPTLEDESQADTVKKADPTLTPETQTKAEVATQSVSQATVASEVGIEASSQVSTSSVGIEASPITFEIVPAESQARFLIDEVLRGDPITVVGATDQVAAQFTIDPNDLFATQVGIIQVNARTLATDNDFRNRAIKNRILVTDVYEFVTFTPTEVVGLPQNGVAGEAYTFQIVGDLTITDVTRQVTFDVVATATSETRIEGVATAAFLYTDFELFIPDAPAVDTVDDEVRLELEFVAEAV
jgi:polyisoprenoid-binding protein YceI